MPEAAYSWQRFAQSGSVYDYLNYKTRQRAAAQQEVLPHGDRDDGPGAAPGQAGGGRPDPDAAQP